MEKNDRREFFEHLYLIEYFTYCLTVFSVRFAHFGGFVPRPCVFIHYYFIVVVLCFVYEVLIRGNIPPPVKGMGDTRTNPEVSIMTFNVPRCSFTTYIQHNSVMPPSQKATATVLDLGMTSTF